MNSEGQAVRDWAKKLEKVVLDLMSICDERHSHATLYRAFSKFVPRYTLKLGSSDAQILSFIKILVGNLEDIANELNSPSPTHAVAVTFEILRSQSENLEYNSPDFDLLNMAIEDDDCTDELGRSIYLLSYHLTDLSLYNPALICIMKCHDLITTSSRIAIAGSKSRYWYQDVLIRYTWILSYVRQFDKAIDLLATSELFIDTPTSVSYAAEAHGIISLLEIKAKLLTNNGSEAFNEALYGINLALRALYHCELFATTDYTNGGAPVDPVAQVDSVAQIDPLAQVESLTIQSPIISPSPSAETESQEKLSVDTVRLVPSCLR